MAVGVALLAAVISAGGAAGTARAFCRLTTISRADGACSFDGVPLEWARRCTSVAVHHAGTPSLRREELIAIVERSAARWTELSCEGAPIGLDVEVLAEPSQCDVAQFDLEQGNVSSFAFVSFAERDGDPSAFAFTTVWHSTRTGEIFDVDMEINADRGPYRVCPDPDGCTGGEGVDLENVLTHEMGHYFGLGHSSDPEATMFAVSPPGEIEKRTLAADDVAGICAIHPPGSLPDACDPTPVGGLLLTCHEEGCCSVAPGRAPPRRGAWIGAAIAAAVLVRRGARRGRRR